VNWPTRARLEKVETADSPMVRYHALRNPGQCQCHLRGGGGVDTPRPRRAGRFRPDAALAARTLYRDDKARGPMAWLLRAANQCPGLTDGHARSPATLDVHGHARVTAGSLAKLEARQPNGPAAASCALARLKRRACNPHLIAHLCEPFAKGQRVETSRADARYVWSLWPHDQTHRAAYILAEVL